MNSVSAGIKNLFHVCLRGIIEFGIMVLADTGFKRFGKRLTLTLLREYALGKRQDEMMSEGCRRRGCCSRAAGADETRYLNIEPMLCFYILMENICLPDYVLY